MAHDRPADGPEETTWSEIRPFSEQAPRPVPPPAPRRTALQVENFSKAYDDTHAVTDLSFRAREGEILGLVGANGAGKTTTLRSIAGILPLKNGTVSVCGHDLVRDELKAKQQLAWIPDDPQPFDSLTVFEHLRFTAALYGVEGWEPRAESLLTTFELQEKRNALGGELSRGMRQKLAFCCAWLHKPGVVLMDEPLSGLDPRGIRSAKEAIRSLAREGSAVILSSHLLELIEELADELLIIHRGQKVFSGTMAEARTSLIGTADATLEDIFFKATESSAKTDG